jgi:DNA-binding SARP family transcriptional activator/pimeloyl-ACP methyl ester carboxylesterase
MLVRVLGDVALLDADGVVVSLPGRRQPALLAALAASAGQALSGDRLADLLWGEDQPENPAAALHSAIFKLRTTLRRTSGRDVLLTREPGYVLQLGPDDVDADVFVRLVETAAHEDPADAAETLRDAVGMWTGPAYGVHGESEVAHLDAIRLEELRRTAVERLGSALVAAGRPAEAVALLRPFSVEHPLREGARVALMRALHATGRTPDALEQFHDYRSQLADELGLEPSAALHAVQRELLEAPAPASHVVPPQRGDGAGRLQGMRVRYLRTRTGRTLAYGTTGAGPPLVVLLGWVSSLEVIASGRDPRSSLLERLAVDVTLTLFDRAGCGLSPGDVDDYGLEASVAELEAVVEEVGAPVSVLAMSAAGPIALQYAHRHPRAVDSLVLFGTFASGPSTFSDKHLRDMVVDIARSHWGLGSKMLADMYRPGLSDEAAWHLSRVLRESAGAEVAASYLDAMYDQDVSPLLPEITAPALVVHYRADRLIPFRGGQQMAAGLPRATFLPLDGKVHLPDAADLDRIEHAIVRHVGEGRSAAQPVS